MDYYSEFNTQEIKVQQIGNYSYFPNATKQSFLAALNFAKTINNEVVKLHNVYGVIVGYAVNIGKLKHKITALNKEPSVISNHYYYLLQQKKQAKEKQLKQLFFIAFVLLIFFCIIQLRNHFL